MYSLIYLIESVCRIIKQKGKDFAKAAKASEDIFPAKNVSTILNNV